MAIRWIKDGEPHVAEVYNRPLRDYIQEVETDYVKQTTRINVGNGLSGGGTLVGSSLNITGVDASASQKGVVRFATLAEANKGTAGLVVSPDVLKNMSGGGLGEGQTWRDVTGSRSVGTNYTNTTGKPIYVSVTSDRSWDTGLALVISGIQVAVCGQGGGDGNDANFVSGIVPNGSVYRVNRLTSRGTIRWTELR